MASAAEALIGIILELSDEYLERASVLIIRFQYTVCINIRFNNTLSINICFQIRFVLETRLTNSFQTRFYITTFQTYVLRPAVIEVVYRVELLCRMIHGGIVATNLVQHPKFVFPDGACATGSSYEGGFARYSKWGSVLAE